MSSPDAPDVRSEIRSPDLTTVPDGAAGDMVESLFTPARNNDIFDPSDEDAGRTERVVFKIRRQDDPFSAPYWQHFELSCSERDNVVAALRRLRTNPVTCEGERVDPVVFDHNCMEEVCGACAMMINGQPRPACSALIENLKQPIVLEPLPKFPLIRDLLVDRNRMFEHLKHVQAWVRIDGPWALTGALGGAGGTQKETCLRVSQQQWAEDYLYSRCMSCGCCLAACPQYDEGQDFVGPAALAQVRLMNAQPTGKFDRGERLHRIMGQGGLSDCGNAQNCVRVCPKAIPLTTAIGELGRATTVQALKDLFGG
ncbi:Fumarate reductase iron-sulfur subunit [Thiorhodovibrio winogradskyi]|uniref:succinate dehydrogenase n=1 Tax=Thiorhodovibrio winogradskyi TaxID=77007 RepID=A0ABZ0SA62_9GAMM|nr:succinate dehydrogenase iron-sulfur subunit [Thiorhodovibrio winogradskyi]